MIEKATYPFSVSERKEFLWVDRKRERERENLHFRWTRTKVTFLSREIFIRKAGAMKRSDENVRDIRGGVVDYESNGWWIIYARMGLQGLRGCGESELSEAIGGGGGGTIPVSGFATRRTTRSWVALSVATASSCVTFSRFLSPCWNQRNPLFTLSARVAPRHCTRRYRHNSIPLKCNLISSGLALKLAFLSSFGFRVWWPTWV